MPTSTLTAARVVANDRVLAPGWVRIDGDRITAVGEGSADGVHLGDVTLVPGFVDLHVHGGGGGSYTEPDPAGIERARRAHLEHGTTSTNASTVAEHPDRLLQQVRVLADAVEAGAIDGIHLEGPWISPARLGAHDATALRTPDLAELTALLDAGRGHIRMVTIAPELPGALDAIRALADHGVVAAVGHTDGTYDQVRGGIEAGATAATHVWNAMRPMHHREPGPIVAVLEDDRVTLELIADGIHLHPALHRLVSQGAAGPRVALVTDAMAAAALGDGDYRLGVLDVTVADGIARVAGTDTIAGSTATMDALFRAAAGDGDHERLVRAARQTATTPAATMGWRDVGRLAAGLRADLVALDADLQVHTVWRAGERVTR